MYQYQCEVIRIIDGDTLDCKVDLGFRASLVMRFRLLGINTPERGQEGAKEAMQRLDELTRGRLIVRTQKDKTEKYGRYLGEFIGADGVTVNAKLVAEGHAVPFMER